MIEIQAPNPYDESMSLLVVFLSGSIEMGKAGRWQEKVLKDCMDKDAIFLNPRRDDWDSSWTQDDPRFSEQVQWELDGLHDSDIIFIYIDPETKSPITLLELGMYLYSDAVIVCCPEGFYRYGNVRETCKWFGTKLYNDLDSAISELRKWLG